MNSLSMNIKKILKALLLALILSIIVIGILSVAVYFLNISDRTISTLIMLLSALCIFFASFVLTKNIEKSGLLNGILLSALYFLVLILLSLLVNGSVDLGFSNFLRLLVTIASGALGGILGINAKK